MSISKVVTNNSRHMYKVLADAAPAAPKLREAGPVRQARGTAARRPHVSPPGQAAQPHKKYGEIFRAKPGENPAPSKARNPLASSTLNVPKFHNTQPFTHAPHKHQPRQLPHDTNTSLLSTHTQTTENATKGPLLRLARPPRGLRCPAHVGGSQGAAARWRGACSYGGEVV